MYVMDYLEEQGFIKSKRKTFDKFLLNGKIVYYFKIFHQAYFYRRLDENKKSNYINQNYQFIKNKILKEILSID